jgi:hypothetical protein
MELESKLVIRSATQLETRLATWLGIQSATASVRALESRSAMALAMVSGIQSAST